MWISQIELHYIKSYGERTRIDLAQGVNAICGHNGAGKSTILEAIGYTLFGKSSYKNQDQFINGRAKKGEIVITLIDERDDRPYQVVRPIKGGTAHVYDPETGHRLAEGTYDVQLWLTECMGVEPTTNLEALFRNAVGVPQGLLTAAFLESEADRRKVFDPLLGVEDYSKASKNLIDTVNHIKDLQAGNREAQARCEGQLVDLPAYRNQMEDLEKTTQSKEIEQEQVIQELAKLEQELTILKEREETVTKLTNRREMLVERVKNLKVQLTEAQAELTQAIQAGEMLEQCRAGYQAYKQAQMEQLELEQRRQVRDEIQQRLGETKHQLALVRQAARTLAERLKNAQAAAGRLIELAPLVEKQGALEQEQRNLEKTVVELKTAEKRVREEEERLTKLKEQWTDMQAQLTKRESLVQEITGLQTERDEQAQKLPPLDEELTGLETQLAATRQALKEAREQQAVYQTTQAKISEEEKAQAQRQSDLTKMQTELVQRHELAAELKTLEAAQQKRREDLLSLEVQINEQEATERQTQKTLSDWETKAQALKHHQATLAAAQKRLAEAEKRLAELEKGIEHRLELSAQLEAFEAERGQESEQRDASRSEIDRYQVQLETIDQAMNALSVDEDSPCPVCQKPLSSHELKSLRAHYQAEQANIKAALEQAQTKLAASETQLKHLSSQIKKTDTKREKLPAQAELETQQAAVVTSREEVVALEQQVTDLAHGPEQVTHYQALLAQAQAMLDELKQAQTRLNQAEAADRSRENQLQARIRDLPRPVDVDQKRDELEQSAAKLAELREKLSSLSGVPEAVKNLEGAEKTLEDQRTRTQQEQRHLNETRAALDTQIQQRQTHLNRLATPAQAEALQATLQAQEKTVAEWQGQVSGLSQAPQQLADLEQALADLNDPRSEQRLKQAEADQQPALEAELAQTQQEIETLQQTQTKIEIELTPFADLDAAIQRGQDTLAANREAHQTYLEQRPIAATLTERQAKVNQRQAAVDEAEVELTAVQRELDQAVTIYDADYYQSTQKQHTEMSSRKVELATELRGEQKRWQELQARISALEKTEAEWEGLKQEAERLTQLSDVVNFIRRTIKEAGPEVTKRLVKAISLKAGQLFNDVMNDYQTELTWDETYAITVKQDGYERVFQQLSGGEAMAAALAVRLALLQGMSAVDVAFFDEPTANLDAERRASLAEQITRIRDFKQLVVISHDDTFEQDTHHVIHIGKDEYGYSQVIA